MLQFNQPRLDVKSRRAGKAKMDKTKTIIHNLKWLTLSLVFGIVLGGGLIAVKAWTEPTMDPPGGNIGAPINTSGIGQAKAGGLILNTGGADNGLIVRNGNVLIGDVPWDLGKAKLHVAGDIRSDAKMRSSFYCDVDGNNCKAVTEMSGGFTNAPANSKWRQIIQVNSNNATWTNPFNFYVHVSVVGRQTSTYTNSCALRLTVNGVTMYNIHNANETWSKSCGGHTIVPAGGRLDINATPNAGSGGITAYALY